METRMRMGTTKAKMQQSAERRKARLKSPERYCLVMASDSSCHIIQIINQYNKMKPNSLQKLLKLGQIASFLGIEEDSIN
jgi:hypothetical protein